MARAAQQSEPSASRPGAGTKRHLSREQIITTAIELLDADGVEKLTMRRLADRLNVGAMSLYWYFKTKEELLDQILDEVIGEADLTLEGATWSDEIRQIAREVRRVLLAHRDVATILASRPTLGPRTLALAEAVLRTLRTAGIAEDEVPLAYHLLVNYVLGFVLTDSTLTGGYAAEADSFMDETVMASFPNIAALGDRLVSNSEDERFEYGFSRILDGLTTAIPTNHGGRRPRH